MRTRIFRFAGRVRAGVVLAPAAGMAVLVCALVFLVQQIAGRVAFVRGTGYTFADCLTYCFGLHAPLLLQGFVWQPVTYMFLHGSLAHLLLNGFTLLFFGSGLEIEVGARRFWGIFLLGGVVGGICWALADLFEPRLLAWLSDGFTWGRDLLRVLSLRRAAGGYGVCIGASGGVFALIGAFAALFPRREVLVLVVVWPVTLKARTLAVLLGVVTLAAAIVGLGQVAYAAHLAGGAAGYAFGLRLRRRASGPAQAR